MRFVMKKIYGNEYLLGTLSSMIESGRTAHSIIFYGEKGSGRKLMAQSYTARLLCESPVHGEPCGICRSCKNVNSGSHPDVIYVPKEGKLESYSVKTARAVINDAFVKPNNNKGIKVYIFADCRDMSVITQNTLLKLIEEPPEYAYFIFTAESKYEFLPTIISRCICLGVSPCSESDAVRALTESGFGKEEIAAAVSCFHGNIGRCTDYIVDEELRAHVDLTKRVADSIIKRDEYSLNASFYSIGSNRTNIREILSMMDRLVRDAAVLSQDSEAKTVGCCREAAVKLAEIITAYQAVNVHNVIEKARVAVDANISAPLVLAALCAEIMNITS